MTESRRRMRRQNPTNRGKSGVKKSLLVEADGGPLALAISGANVPDSHLLALTLDAVVVERPQPTPEQPQNLALDKGYDNPTSREAVEKAGYTPYIRRIGEETLDENAEKRHRRVVG
jgi:putative transposase